MGHPALQVFLPSFDGEMLPGVIGRQVEFAGATRYADAAANGREPFVLGKGMADFSLHLLQLRKAVLYFVQRLQERRFGNGGVALVAGKALLLAIQIAHDFGLEVGAAGYIEDFEQRDQGKVVVNGLVALLQMRKTVKQPLQPQPGADAFIEGVFVQDHLAVPLAQS